MFTFRCMHTSLLVGIAIGSLSVMASEPLITIQSKSTHRFLAITNELGLPDPIASMGLETSATIERLQESIDFESPVAAHVYHSEDRPFLVICFPLTRQKNVDELFSPFAVTHEREPDGIYRLGNRSILYAIPTPNFLVIGDSKLFLREAVSQFEKRTESNDDLAIHVDFRPLIELQKGMLKREVLSTLATKPITSFAFNSLSIREHLKCGLQRYLIQSLFESESFDLKIQQDLNGDLQVRLETLEKTSGLRLASRFQDVPGRQPLLHLDFSSKLLEETASSAIDWIANAEREFLDAIRSDEVEDTSSASSVEQLVRLGAELGYQSLKNQRVDGFLAIGGGKETENYAVAAIHVADSQRLSELLYSALEANRSLGIRYDDLRVPNERTKRDRANLTFELPTSWTSGSAASSLPQRVHLQVADQKVLVSIGEEGERIASSIQTSPESNTTHPVTLVFDTERGSESDAEVFKNYLPGTFRKMEWKVDVIETGRVYQIGLSKTNTPKTFAEKSRSR